MTKYSAAWSTLPYCDSHEEDDDGDGDAEEEQEES